MALCRESGRTVGPDDASPSAPARRVGGSGERALVCRWGLIGSVGTALGLAWAPSYAVFAVALMLGGLGNAAFHPRMAALVSRNRRTNRGRALSGWMVSGMVGNLLGGSISDARGTRPVLVASLIEASVSAVVGGMATTGTGWQWRFGVSSPTAQGR